MAHTKTPWELSRDSFGVERIWAHVNDEDGCDWIDVASCEGDGSIPYEQRQANAAFIVRAVNSFEAMRDALKDERHGTTGAFLRKVAQILENDAQAQGAEWHSIDAPRLLALANKMDAALAIADKDGE